jgi:multiple sugar transport system ATP-binding protein
MDEPLSNLDAKLRVQMRAEVQRIQRRINLATLYVTHDQVEAMTMGDRVAVLRAGNLEQVDHPRSSTITPTTCSSPRSSAPPP